VESSIVPEIPLVAAPRGIDNRREQFYISCVMNMRLTLAALLFAGAAVRAQPYEFDIPLPDSLGGVGSPVVATCAPTQGLVYVGGRYGDVAVVDCAAHVRKPRIPTQTGAGVMFFNPNNDHLYVGSEVITVIDCATNSVAKTIDLGFASSSAAFNPVSNKLYYCEGLHPIAVVDCAGDSILYMVTTGVQLGALTVSTVSNKVYVGDLSSSNILVLDGDPDTATGHVNAPSARMCYNPQMDLLYATDGNRSSTLVIDCSLDSVIDSIPMGGNSNYKWIPRANKLYYQSGNTAVDVVDCSTDSIVRSVRVPARATSYTCDTLRNEVYVACFGEPCSVAVIDASADSIVATLPISFNPQQGCWNPQNGEVYIPSCDSGVVTVIDGTSHSIFATLTIGEKIGRALYAGGEGKLYCFETDSGRLAVCDTGARQVMKHLPVGRGIDNLVYDRSRQKLFCGGDSGIAVVSTISDSILMLRRGFMARAISLDQVGGRVFFSPSRSSGSVVRVLDAASNEFVDSMALTAPGLMCFDPLTNMIMRFTHHASAVESMGAKDGRVGNTRKTAVSVS